MYGALLLLQRFYPSMHSVAIDVVSCVFVSQRVWGLPLLDGRRSGAAEMGWEGGEGFEGVATTMRRTNTTTETPFRNT